LSKQGDKGIATGRPHI